jgi:hypothetical protein
MLKLPIWNSWLKKIRKKSNYISLIFLYSKNDEEKKAFEIVQKLEKAIPNSE